MCRVTDHLYISNSKAAASASLVIGNNITCIINATEGRRGSAAPPGVEYIHIPVSDCPSTRLSDHFDRVSDHIQRTAAAGGRTLVHCNAGVSRSAALCMAFLLKHRGVTLLQAHSWLKTRRPLVRPNNGFWEQLIRYERELRGCISVRMVSSPMGEIPDIYAAEARNMLPLDELP